MRVSLFTLAILFSLLIVALAHAGDSQQPANYFIPMKLPAGYGQAAPAEMQRYNVGDLTFLQQYPMDITPLERFMILGGTHPQSHRYVDPWINQVLMHCRGYYSRHQFVPDQVTPEVIAENGSLSVAEAEAMVLFKNPFTGEWPRARAASPSAGDFYCRPLTDSEIRNLAEMYPTIKHLYYDGVDPRGEPAELRDVWYVRAYGEGGRVIFSEANALWRSTRE